MQIAKSKKFEGTVLAIPIPPYVKDTEPYKKECWEKLCSIYGVDLLELPKSEHNNPWAKLSRAIAEDVFPGFDKVRRAKKKRTLKDEKYIYEAFKMAREITDLKEEAIFHELAKHEAERTNKHVSTSIIKSIVNAVRGDKIGHFDKKRKIEDVIKDAIDPAEDYYNEDIRIFLAKLYNLERPSQLDKESDPRSKDIYRKQSSK